MSFRKTMKLRSISTAQNKKREGGGGRCRVVIAWKHERDQ